MYGMWAMSCQVGVERVEFYYLEYPNSKTRPENPTRRVVTANN